MRIERFGAQDERRADACYEIFRATRAVDDPDVPLMSRRVWGVLLTTGWVGDPRETWLLADDDGVAGWYLLELPARDNRHLGFLDIAVRPERQRRGSGTALLRHAASRAVADGRRLLTGYALTGTAGEAFARAAGATGGQTEIRRAMDTGTISAERAAGLLAARILAAADPRLLQKMLGFQDQLRQAALAKGEAVRSASAVH